MPWEKPTLKQLNERIAGDFSGRLLDSGKPLVRSVIAVLAKVWSGASYALHSVLAWIYRQVFIDTAEGPNLRRWADVWAIPPKEEDYASGICLFPGMEDAVFPATTLIQHRATGSQYVAREDGAYSGGNMRVPVKALEAGTAANLPAGAEVVLVAPLDGIQSTGLVDAGGITGGVDAETDDELRMRLLARLRRPPRGGSKADYEAWALEVPGVTRAWCYPLGLGLGTVSLTVVTDNAPDGPIPSEEMVQRVKDHIEPLRPATVKDFEVFAPEPLPIAIRLAVNPDTEAVRAAVLAELGDLIAREGVPGATLYRSHINEAVSIAPGEFDHILLEPEHNIEVPEGYFPMLTDVVFDEYPQGA